MNEHPIHLTTEDHAKLRKLVDALSGAARAGTLPRLREELDRAIVLDAKVVPANVVTMNAHVEIEDSSTGEIEAYTLVYPEQADVEQHRLSILAPIGTALLGYAEGDEVSWSTPGGIRRLKIRHVSRTAAPAPVAVPPGR